MRFKKPVYTLLSALFLNSVTLSIQAVQINESFNPIFNEGEFTVINDSVDDIFAFFVANNNALQADKAGGPVLDSWRPAVTTRSDWVNGIVFSALRESIWTPPDTSQIDWDNVFGATFDRALAYWSDGFLEIPQASIAAGSTENGFLFISDTPASPWIAFGVNGTVATGVTNNTVVPAPTAVWLFGSGVVGLAGLFRRLKQPKKSS